MSGLPGRTVSRGRGCWSCSHFASVHSDPAGAELFRKRFTEVIKSELAQLRVERGDGIDGTVAIRPDGSRIAAVRHSEFESGDVVNPKHLALYEMPIRLAARGELGMCMKSAGNSFSDFKHFQVYCPQWSGRSGHSLATAGHKPDLLPDELRDLMDSKARKLT